MIGFLIVVSAEVSKQVTNAYNFVGGKNKPEWIPAELASIVPRQLLRGTIGGDLRNQIINVAESRLVKTENSARKSGTPGLIEALSHGISRLVSRLTHLPFLTARSSSSHWRADKF